MMRMVRQRTWFVFSWAIGIALLSVYQLSFIHDYSLSSIDGPSPTRHNAARSTSTTRRTPQEHKDRRNAAFPDDNNPIIHITFDPNQVKATRKTTTAHHLPPLQLPPLVKLDRRTTPQDSNPKVHSTTQQHSNPPNSGPTQPLNIVLLYADDWSYNSLGVAGNDYVQTPYLDQMAKNGIFFTHNCVVSSVCMQSRATLYTGQYSSRHQTYFAYRDIKMYEEGKWNQTLYPLMKQAGYYVGFFGKYHHIEDLPRGVPTFDEFMPMPFDHYVTRYDNVTKHITEWNELDAMRFLRTKPPQQPFFLTVSFFATHAQDGAPVPYEPMESSMKLYRDQAVPLPKTYTEEHWRRLPKFFDDFNVGRGRFRERYNNHSQYDEVMKNTYRMVTEVDAACGRIVRELERTGELNHTLVIFTTDNGNLHGQHGLAEKWYAYEESLRVPLILHDPRSKAPTVISDFTLNIDLAPTILSAAGVEVPEVMQGADMADLYLRHQPGRQEFLYEFADDNPDIMNSLALVQKDFKYIYWNDYKYHEAFNLTEDPFEENNLFHSMPKDTFASVEERMARLQASIRMGQSQ